jgi:hypothetical protein
MTRARTAWAARWPFWKWNGASAAASPDFFNFLRAALRPAANRGRLRPRSPASNALPFCAYSRAATAFPTSRVVEAPPMS